MSELFKKIKKYKYKLTILSVLPTFMLLYTIHFYMEHSILKFLLWIIAVLIPTFVKAYEKKLNQIKR
ncbi:hypothetical protein [Clostridium sp.]|uniref:hypothetical protein n=1 Tax=Clostridium sp. TaxID=1506 RepID=UPI001D6FD29B|nr:hypothetical protein [Clostridium sp.]MBS5937845.1 hypothetical protein [Clostridium sp.]